MAVYIFNLVKSLTARRYLSLVKPRLSRLNNIAGTDPQLGVYVTPHTTKILSIHPLLSDASLKVVAELQISVQ